MAKAGSTIREGVGADQLVTFRAGDLAHELTQRRNRDERSISPTAKADLGRYYTLLKISRDSLAGRFSSAEMNRLVLAVYGKRAEFTDLGWWEQDTARLQTVLLNAKILDAARRYKSVFKVDDDAGALLRKIEGLNTLEVAALLDTLERYWTLRQTVEHEADQAEVYEAFDFRTSDRPRLVAVLPRPEPAQKGTKPMSKTREKTLAETVRDFLNDPNVRLRPDATDVLHVRGLLAGKARHITFGEVTADSLDGLDDDQRAAVVATLFENAADWPDGTADVRCVSDGVVISTMMSQTDIYVFVNNEPVSRGVRITVPMVPA